MPVLVVQRIEVVRRDAGPDVAAALVEVRARLHGHLRSLPLEAGLETAPPQLAVVHEIASERRLHLSHRVAVMPVNELAHPRAPVPLVHAVSPSRLDQDLVDRSGSKRRVRRMGDGGGALEGKELVRIRRGGADQWRSENSHAESAEAEMHVVERIGQQAARQRLPCDRDGEQQSCQTMTMTGGRRLAVADAVCSMIHFEPGERSRHGANESRLAGKGKDCEGRASPPPLEDRRTQTRGLDPEGGKTRASLPSHAATPSGLRVGSHSAVHEEAEGGGDGSGVEGWTTG